jgi:hypothetical protein
MLEALNKTVNINKMNLIGVHCILSGDNTPPLTTVLQCVIDFCSNLKTPNSKVNLYMQIHMSTTET